MESTMKDRAMLRVLAGVFTASVMLGGPAIAQEKPAPTSTPPEIKDERALKLLKAMSDKLGNAKSLSFRVRGLVPTVAPTGQYISLFASSSVVMQRPDKLFVAARGDMFPSDIFYNGKTIPSSGWARSSMCSSRRPGPVSTRSCRARNPVQTRWRHFSAC